ncbi:MAG: DNA (cytosine-5-)-methyltransferase [Methanosphaera sp.]|nr:DNA (cytosine-5-)-methyltransferase [Methanosphaera sp.]
MIKLNENEKDMLKNLRFIDLFSGIGAFRIAFESFGANCVFSIDKDKYASETYDKNFNTKSRGDICNINEKDIPEHDILCAGFPCQAFSVSGKQLGFEDMRGTLFFEITRIVKHHKPKIIFLENVSNLEKHDNGKTFRIIKENLEKLGYNLYYKVINASEYGVAQSRKRIYIICIRKDIDNHQFKFPKPTNEDVALEDILLKDNMDEFILNKEYKLDESKLNTSRTNKPIRVGTVNKGGQGDRIYSNKGHAITLSATGGGNGAKTGLYYIDNKVRKLHPRETARLMGFPEDYEINPSTAQAHKQFGNSIIVDILQYIIRELINDGSVYNG